MESLCTEPDFLKLIVMARTILTIVKVLLPLIIIVTTSMDGIKIVMNDGAEELKKMASKLGVRLVAAVLIFLYLL